MERTCRQAVVFEVLRGARCRPVLGALVTAGLLLNGCGTAKSVKIEMGPLPKPAKPATGQIVLLPIENPKAAKHPEEIGANTFTVFALPVGQIKAEEPYTPRLDGFLREALQSAGYTVLSESEAKGSTVPRLRAKTEKFWFITYMWFWPLMLGGGDCNLALQLEAQDGKVVWKRTFRKYVSAGELGSFKAEEMRAVVKDAITRCLGQVVEVTASQEFTKALSTAQSSPPLAKSPS